jgi:cation transporter-like permease
MPQSPIILPIIITGLTLGSVLASQTKKISKKKLVGVSLITGLLNSAYAYLFYELNPPPTFSRGTYAGTYAASARFQTGGGTSVISFIISSFFTGFIFVIAVCGIAILYARFRGKKDHEEDELEDEKTVDNEDEMKKLEKLEDT